MARVLLHEAQLVRRSNVRSFELIEDAFNVRELFGLLERIARIVVDAAKAMQKVASFAAVIVGMIRSRIADVALVFAIRNSTASPSCLQDDRCWLATNARAKSLPMAAQTNLLPVFVKPTIRNPLNAEQNRTTGMKRSHVTGPVSSQIMPKQRVVCVRRNNFAKQWKR